MTDPQGYAAALQTLAGRAGLPRRTQDHPGALEMANDGVPIVVRTWGHPSARPLLFVHGSGQTAHTWDLVARALGDDFYCLAPHLRGHGRSGWSPAAAYSVQDHARDLGRALASWLPERQTVVVGFSLGAMAALRLTASPLDSIAGLALIDMTPHMLSGDRRPSNPHASRLGDNLRQAPPFSSIDEFVTLALARNPGRDADLLRTTIRTNLRRTPDGRWTWAYDPATLASLPTTADALWADAATVRCPVLVVHGSHSPLVSADNVREFTHSFADPAVLEVVDAGHNIPGDNPAALYRVLDEWLRDVGK
jgi:pimeloyl-ACP methyl ester carboxylesterase